VRVPELETVASPAAGQGWEKQGPIDKRWRLWAGSCLLTTTATAGRREPYLLYDTSDGSGSGWAGGQDGPWQDPFPPDSFVGPSSAVRLMLTESRAERTKGPLLGTHLLVPSRAIWLPPQTVIRLEVHNVAAGDTLTQIVLYREEIDA
jgi:hypothetical protein